jgi:hypothetical protein
VNTSAARGATRSTPVNMPGVRPIVPVLIDSGSASQYPSLLITSSCLGASTQCLGASTQCLGASTQCLGAIVQFLGASAQCVVHSAQFLGASAQCLGASAQCLVPSAHCLVRCVQILVPIKYIMLISRTCTYYSPFIRGRVAEASQIFLQKLSFYQNYVGTIMELSGNTSNRTLSWV